MVVNVLCIGSLIEPLHEDPLKKEGPVTPKTPKVRAPWDEARSKVTKLANSVKAQVRKLQAIVVEIRDFLKSLDYNARYLSMVSHDGCIHQHCG
jgi:hypothetical protein